MNRCAALAAFVLLDLSFASPASADPAVAACIEANARAQLLRRDGHFIEARAQLRACLDPTCPKLVRQDCAQQLDQLDAAQPSLLVDVQDTDGRDVTGARIAIDGAERQDHVDRVPVPLDPGPHTIVLSAPGRVSVTRVVVLREGDKARREQVVLERLASAPTFGPESRHIAQARRTPALVLGAAGLGALATGLVFAGLAEAATHAYERHCGSSIGAPPGACNAEGIADHDDAVRKATVATVIVAGGAVALAAGLTLFVFSGQTARSSVTATVGPASLRVAFEF